MKRICLVSLAVVLLVLLIPVFSMSCGGVVTPHATAWNKTFDNSDSDQSYSVQQTSDGGYIIAGLTGSNGTSYSDVWLIKTDSSGTMAWNRTFGGSDEDRGYSVHQTSDGGYIIAGETASYGADNSSDVWLIKTDSSGNLAWNQTFGGSDWDEARSVQQTSDGGYIIAGFTYSYGAGDGDVWLTKTDSGGNLAWNKTFGGICHDEAKSVRQTSDGGYIIAGSTVSYGVNGSVWLIKTDSSGDLAWNQTFGGSDSDWGQSVQQTSDGGYVIAGYTRSYGAGDWDAWLIKTDSSGNLAWNKTFGGSEGDSGYSVQQTLDGGYVIAGRKGTSHMIGEYDAWLIKTDSSGNWEWDKTFGDLGDDEARSVQQTLDGGYVIAGFTGSWDVWLIKVTA